MSAPPPAVARYLERRAVAGPWQIDGHRRDDFRAAVVIPALAESAALPATLAALAANPAELLAETLVLVVVNQRPDSTAADKEDNARTLRQLADGTLGHPGLQLAWVDAASEERELPAKDGGVGLARKIGFDLALSRLSWRGEEPLLIALDADTLVEPNYLAAIFGHFRDCAEGGAVLPFCHQPGANAAEHQAIVRYELFLRSHALGLELADSPYAFHTVGSTMACRATAYAGAGGMNRRKAGEDFYFLQQLAKTAGISQLSGTVVHPAARPSARTPFGTGRSVARLLAGDSEAVRFYHPECYRILGAWLQLVSGRSPADGAQLLNQAAKTCRHLVEFLEQEGFIAIWQRLTDNHRTAAARNRAFHGWFDGLKTTRLIHHLCAGPYPRCAAEQSVPQLLNAAGLPPSPTLAGQLKVLRRHQGAEPDPG